MVKGIYLKEDFLNKKFLFVGMAAVLGASLVFFGCNHGDSDGGGSSNNAILTKAVVKGRPVNLDLDTKSSKLSRIR
jgi:hypothetical protein